MASKTSKYVETEKLMAALSYFVLTAPSILMTEKKNKFVRFHASQGLGLLLVYLVLRAVVGLLQTIFFIPFLFAVPIWMLILTAILCLHLMIMTLNGKKIKIPVVYDVGTWLTKTIKW